MFKYIEFKYYIVLYNRRTRLAVGHDVRNLAGDTRHVEYLHERLPASVQTIRERFNPRIHPPAAQHALNSFRVNRRQLLTCSSAAAAAAALRRDYPIEKKN